MKQWAVISDNPTTTINRVCKLGRHPKVICHMYAIFFHIQFKGVKRKDMDVRSNSSPSRCEAMLSRVRYNRDSQLFGLSFVSGKVTIIHGEFGFRISIGGVE